MRTDRELDAICQHLRYEFAMLWAAGAEIRTQGLSWGARNAVVEAIALHTRNVVDFFYTDPVDDDVVARHFFTDESAWAIVRPLITPALAAAKKRANKEVAHLTYSRLSVAPENKPWPTDEIVRDVDLVLRAFCDKADRLPDSVRLLKYRDLLP